MFPDPKARIAEITTVGAVPPPWHPEQVPPSTGDPEHPVIPLACIRNVNPEIVAIVATVSESKIILFIGKSFILRLVFILVL